MFRPFRFVLPAVLLALALVAVSPSDARGQAVDAGKADAAGKADGFAAHFRADDKTFLVVEDPLPHLKALLTSEGLRKVMSRGPLGELARDLNDGEPIDPSIGWDWLLKNRRWVPQQVAIGMSDTGQADIDHLFRLLTVFELINTIVEHEQNPGNNPQISAELKTLRTALLAEAQKAQLPRMKVYVRFRVAEDALALLDLLKAELDDIEPKDLPPGLRVDRQDRRVTATFTLADVFENDKQIAELLEGMGLTDPADAAHERDLVAVLRKFKAEMSLEVVGSGLLLTMGQLNPAGAAPGQANVGPLPAAAANLPPAVGKVDAATLLWGRWDIRRLKQAGRDWSALRQQWLPSATYALLKANESGSEPLIDVLQTMATQLGRLSETGSMRVSADHAAGAVRLAMQEDKAPLAPPLPAHAVARFIPADATAWSADTTTSAGEFLSDYLLQVEDQMATRSLRAEFKPNDAQARNAAAVEAGYYTHFGKFRDLVHKTGRDRFQPGVLFVADTRGRVERVEASFEVDSRPIRLSLRDLPMIELALVGQPKAPADEAAVKRYAEELYAAFATGIRSAARGPQLAGQPLPPVKANAEKVDLGLGVNTFAFKADWLAEATGEAKLALDVKGDLRPHFFLADGCLVFSTSPRLSKSMLDARSGKTPRMALPATQAAEGTLVSAGRVSGDTIGGMFDHLGKWLDAALGDLDRAAGRPLERDKAVADALGLIAHITRLMDRAEWRTTQSPGQPAHVTRGAMYFATPKE